MMGAERKVRAEHLRRRAYLYIRQSTLRQVIENTESTARQYDLRQRAVALGWAEEQVVVIDNDLGLSGASAVGREGFQHLVSEVGLGRAGIVMGLEVSRLARRSSDWHRLVEICALSETLILDEDGLYDPREFNDRLLLGLKGAMSEAELHLLRARLDGGRMNKLKRGELVFRLPSGFVHDPHRRVALDPDRQVQQTTRLFFETFRRVGTAGGVVRSFRNQGTAAASSAVWEARGGWRSIRNRARSGTSWPWGRTPATSAGTTTRRISLVSRKTRAPPRRRGGAHPAKVPRCCRGWCCAGGAARA